MPQRTLWSAVRIALFGTLMLTSIPAHAQRTVRCGGKAQDLVFHLRWQLSDVAPGHHIRDWWTLPTLPPDSVVLVTDDSICNRAAHAYYAYTLGELPEEIAVARVGDRYAVYGDLRGGEWTSLTIFTLDWWVATSIGI